MQTAVAAAGAAAVPFEALGQDVCSVAKNCAMAKCLPPPSFSLLGAESIAGVRPHREDTYRLRRLEKQGKFIIHNYGHGGAGITMSLGCAERVKRYVKDIIDENPGAASEGIAVLGGGVMGLTAARALANAYFPGIKIDLFTKKTYAETTSHKAGGQWSPASVDFDDTQAFKELLKSSWDQFNDLLGKGYGVSTRINYTLYDEGGLERAYQYGLIKRDDPYSRLPFANMNCSGYGYHTLLIEPPIFLKKLHNDLVKKLGKKAFWTATFPKRLEGEPFSAGVANLKQKIVVNCTGLSGSELFEDQKKMTPIKGHLIKLKLPPQKLDYLFSGYDCDRWVQYLFPRSDGVIVGGTYQKDRNDEKISFKVGTHMVSTMKNLFEGKLAPACDDNIPTPKSVEDSDNA
jgi:glycine/D-amino acid oxidase-like deaminating enzyme